MNEQISTCIYLLFSVFFVCKFHWFSAWSTFKLTGCLVQIMFLSFGAGCRPGVSAELEFGRVTKLLWLGDSLNTAKQLVRQGESSVGRFHRNSALAWASLPLGEKGIYVAR